MISVCRPINKMPKGPLYKATERGNVEASIVVIHATGQLQTIARSSPTTITTVIITHHYHHHHHNTHTRARAPSSLSHTRAHTHMHSHNHKQMQMHTRTHSLTHQQVRSLLASGIKPDAERDDGVSVFWCCVRLVLAHRRCWRVAQ